MTAVAADRQRHHSLGLVGTVVDAFLRPIQEGYLAVPDNPRAVARLAQLRHGAGKTPGDVPALWGLTGAERLYEDNRLSEEQAARAESAAFAAITLYSLHQQSRREKRMHACPGPELGEAVRRLMPGAEIDERLRRRFVDVGQSTAFPALVYRLRAVVTLLRQDSVPLDYGRLADRLYTFQSGPDGMRRVRQAWGRSFHAYQHKSADAPTNTDAPTAADQPDTADKPTDKDAS